MVATSVYRKFFVVVDKNLRIFAFYFHLRTNMYILRSKHLHNLPTSITIGNAQIPFKQSVKNLGFTLDHWSSYYECTCLQYCSDMLL